jgi:hypothetical protein
MTGTVQGLRRVAKLGQFVAYRFADIMGMSLSLIASIAGSKLGIRYQHDDPDAQTAPVLLLRFVIECLTAGKLQPMSIFGPFPWRVSPLPGPTRQLETRLAFHPGVTSRQHTASNECLCSLPSGLTRRITISLFCAKAEDAPFLYLAHTSPRVSL